MKTKKIIELINSTQSFSDVYDLVLAIDAAKGITFGFIFKSDSVICEVIKVTKKIISKTETKYIRTELFKVEGVDIVQAFQKGALQHFNK